MAWTSAVTRATGYGVTAAVWNSEHVDNMNFLKRVGNTEFTADVPITGTTAATANQIVSAGAITYEAVPHLVEFFACRYTAPAQLTTFIFRDGTTILGTFVRLSASEDAPSLTFRREFTPTAASHTYNIAAWVGAASTGTVEAGSGGAAGDATTYLPGFIRVTRVPT